MTTNTTYCLRSLALARRQPRSCPGGSGELARTIWALSEQDSFRTAVAGFDPNRAMADRLARQGIRIVPNNREAAPNPVAEVPKPLDFLIVDMRGRVGGNIGIADQHLKTLEQGDSYWGRSRTFGRTRPGQLQIQLSTNQNPSFRGR